MYNVRVTVRNFRRLAKKDKKWFVQTAKGGQGDAVMKALASTNVARVQIPASTPYVGWVCCWFSPLQREVFLRVHRFSPVLKNQHVQIPIRSRT